MTHSFAQFCRAFAALSLTTVCAYAAPLLINYQGTLEDPELPPIAIVEMEFRLWASPAASEGESLLWGRRYEVRVEESRFHVIIGSSGLRDSVTDSSGNEAQFEELDLALANGGRFVGITVIATDLATGETRGEGIELAPRQALLSVPHAIASERLAGGLSEGEEDALTQPPRIAFSTGESIEFVTGQQDVAASLQDFPVRAGALLKLTYRGTLRYESPAGGLATAVYLILIDENGAAQTVRTQAHVGAFQEPLTSTRHLYVEWVGFVDNETLDSTRSIEVAFDGVTGMSIETGAENQLLIAEELLNGRELP